jgi:uncharacterized protein
MTISKKFILHYHLQAHPEGGWYKETYKSNEYIPRAALPERFAGERVFSTAIYFLLERGNFSAFHRIKADECWHFYAGDPLLIYLITPGGLDIIRMGNNIDDGQLFQYVVPANYWFAARPAPGSRYCFTGCTVAPGFDFADFELADAAALSVLHPQHEKIIKELCR